MITVQINDQQVQAALNRVAASLADMSPLMGDLGEMLLASTQDRMLRGEQPDGAAFAPRSQTTLDRYAKLEQTYGPVPLFKSGEMRQQLAYRPGPDYLELSSNAIQSAVMQFGAKQGAFGAFIGKDKRGRDHFHSIPWGDIPARPFLGLSEQDKTDILAEIAEWIGGAARGD